MAIQIVDWGKHYENYRTRELKRMEWVPLPNRHDGDGYTELLNHVNGSAHFGAWCALLQIASKCKDMTAADPGKGPHRDSGKYDRTMYPHGRGILRRETGEPHDEETLERITRIPVAIWREALPRLQSIGWIRGYEISVVDRYDVGSRSVVDRWGVPNERNGKEEEKNKKRVGTSSVGGTEIEPDIPPFDELPQKPADSPAPAAPVPSGPEYRLQLQQRANAAEQNGDPAALLLYGLELLHGGPFASYPKEWASAKKLVKSLTTMSRGNADLCTAVRDMLRVYQHKRRSSRETYWKEAPLTPSGVLCRLEQLVSFAGKQRENAKLDEISAKAMRSKL